MREGDAEEEFFLQNDKPRWLGSVDPLANCFSGTEGAQKSRLGSAEINASELALVHE